MEAFVNIAQALIGNVRINLGGRYILVTKKFLHASQIGAVVEKVGRVGVPEPARSDLF